MGKAAITILMLLPLFILNCAPKHQKAELSSLDAIGSSQGKTLYNQNCSVCHGAIAASTILDVNFAQIRTEISQNPAMLHLAWMSDAEITLIAEALGSAPSAEPAELTFQNGGVFPARSIAGAQFRITAKYVSQKSYSQLNVNLKIKNPAGVIVDTRSFAGLNVSAGNPLIIEHLFSTTDTTAPGQYKLEAEVTQNGQAVVPTLEANAFYLYPPIRIVAGSPNPFVDSTGRTWAADSGFTGGSVLNPWPAIMPVAGTNDPYIFNGLRWGEFNYRFAVPAGAKYKVQLLFAENFVTGAGQRLFSVRLNSATVLQNLDIFAETGGMWRSLTKTFSIQPIEDAIQIDFVRGPIQEPKAGAIVITGDQL